MHMLERSPKSVSSQELQGVDDPHDPIKTKKDAELWAKSFDKSEKVIAKKEKEKDTEEPAEVDLQKVVNKLKTLTQT